LPTTKPRGIEIALPKIFIADLHTDWLRTICLILLTGYVIGSGVEMIEYRNGNILESEAEALVNAVNCVGVMGRGVALQFKNAFPENFKAYVAACKLKLVQPGRMFVFETGLLIPPRFIINFPTKRHWHDKSRIEDIESGLVALAKEIRARRIRSVALPALGCGLGGLRWADVRPRIEATLQTLDDDGIRVFVYEPQSFLASIKAR